MSIVAKTSSRYWNLFAKVSRLLFVLAIIEAEKAVFDDFGGGSIPQ